MSQRLNFQHYTNTTVTVAVYENVVYRLPNAAVSLNFDAWFIKYGTKDIGYFFGTPCTYTRLLSKFGDLTRNPIQATYIM
jgi:hypothetical protein